MLLVLNIIIKVIYALESNISNIIPMNPYPRLGKPLAYPYRNPYFDPLLKDTGNRSN